MNYPGQRVKCRSLGTSCTTLRRGDRTTGSSAVPKYRQRSLDLVRNEDQRPSTLLNHRSHASVAV